MNKYEKTRYEEQQKKDNLWKEKFLKENPNFIPDGDFWDSHSCTAYADDEGYCMICGAAVYGTQAYRELYDYE